MLLVVLVSAVAIVWAGRSSAGSGPVAEYLPGRPATTVRLDRQDGGPWQVTQGRLGGMDAWSELSAPARRLITAAPANDWLTVDLLRPGTAEPNTSLDFEVAAEVVLLRAITGADRSLVFDPGVPVLSAGLLAGSETHWTGRLARDRDAATSGEARVTAAPGAPRPGCVLSSVIVGGQTEAFGFCPGAGLVAWTSDPAGTGFGDGAASRPPPVPAAAVPAMPLQGREPRSMLFFRNGSNVYQPQLAPSGSRAVWAGDRLVIADTAGRLTAWLPSPAVASEPESLYTQRWRSQPGGSVRGLAAADGLVFAGTTEREVIAYDAVGWEQWRHPLPDAVTHLTALPGRVVVVDADGLLRVLSAGSGEVAWETEGVTELLGVGGDPGTVVLARDSEVAVLDLATGRALWDVRADGSAVRAVPFGPVVAVLVDNWLVVRDRATGDVRWLRTVADDSLVYPLGTSLLLSEPHAAAVLDAAGTELWRSTGDLPVVLPIAAAGQLIGVTDTGLLLAGPGLPTLTWRFPEGARRPELAPLRGGRGLIAMQLVGDRFRWLEYS